MTSVVKRILAPVDLAESREPDLDYAIGLASQLGAELMLLVVVDTPATLNLIGHHGSTGRGGGKDVVLSTSRGTRRLAGVASTAFRRKRV